MTELRVWHITNMPSDPEHWPVESIGEGQRLIEALAKNQLRCDCVVTNMFGLQYGTADGDWEEVEDENGYTVNEQENFDPSTVQGLSATAGETTTRRSVTHGMK